MGGAASGSRLASATSGLVFALMFGDYIITEDCEDDGRYDATHRTSPRIMLKAAMECRRPEWGRFEDEVCSGRVPRMECGTCGHDNPEWVSWLTCG